MIVLDLSLNDSELRFVTPAECERLKVKPDGSQRLVLAYLSVGEVDTKRWYWPSEWLLNPPAWVGADMKRREAEWIAQDERKLPCQIRLTYNKQPGTPSTRVVFSDWNPAAQIADATFTPNVPSEYERLKIMRNLTVRTAAPEAAPAGAPAAPAQTPRR